VSDRRTIEAGAKWIGSVMVAKADGSAITTGTVNAYVLSKDGTNSGKWYRNSDSTWQASETANATTFGGGAQWSISFTNSPFADGLHYEVYFKESGALHVPTGYLARCEYTPSADSSRRIDMGSHLGTAQSAGRDLGSVLPSAAVNAAGGLRAPVVAAGTCQAGSSTTTINLAAGTTAVAVGDRIRLLSGTGSPAEAPITGTLLGGSPPSVSVAAGWITNAPLNTTTYIIVPGTAPQMSTAGYGGLDALGNDTQNGKEDLGTAQTGDAYAIVNSATFGNAKLVRSTTPANTLDVSATGEAGLDFSNIKDAGSAHTLTNITVPAVTAAGSVTGAVGSVTGNVGGNVVGTVASVVGAVGSVTGNVGGNVTGSVGSVTGSVTVGTNNDKTGYSLLSTQSFNNTGQTTKLAATIATGDAADVTTALARLGTFTGTGANTAKGFLAALASKTATTPSDVGGTFDPSTDSVEAIRDRGDAAWTTGAGGGGGGDASEASVQKVLKVVQAQQRPR
jgi:hypothetical protein